MFFQCFNITGDVSLETAELAAFRFDGDPMRARHVLGVATIGRKLHCRITARFSSYSRRRVHPESNWKQKECRELVHRNSGTNTGMSKLHKKVHG